MSYIDTVNHSDVGIFLGLGLYHPLEQLDDEGFEMGPGNLLLGGGGAEGGGETPSMGIESPIWCVYEWMKMIVYDYPAIIRVADQTPYCITPEIEYASVIRRLDELREKIESDFGQQMDSKYNLTHYWSFELINRFSKKINKRFKLYEGFSSKPVISKFEENTVSYSSEEKLNILLGEVIYSYMNDFLSLEYRQILKEIEEKFEKQDRYFGRILTVEKVFQPAVPNWSCSGRILYRNESVEIQTMRPVPYFLEKQYLAELGDTIVTWNHPNPSASESKENS